MAAVKALAKAPRGGTRQVGENDALIGQADAMTVLAAGAIARQSMPNIVQRLLSPYDFGAVSDAVIASDNSASASLTAAVNTVRLQAYFDACRDARLPWVLPLEDWLIDAGVKAYGPGIAHGRILAPNDGANKSTNNNEPWGAPFVIAPYPEDILVPPTLSEIKAWSNCVRGSNRIVGLTGRKGQYITILTTDQMLVDRRDKGNTAPGASNSSFNPIYMGEGFEVVSDEGHIADPLIENWNTAAWTEGNTTITAQRVRPPIDVVLPDVILVGPAVPNADTQGRRAGLQVTCCNVNARGGSVLNLIPSVPPLQGISRTGCCGVNFTGTRVFTLGQLSTQYGFNQNLTCRIADNDCSASGCRRGWDATRGKGSRVKGGSYPDGMGAHYATDTVWSGIPLISCRTTANPVPISISGGDLTVDDCNIVLPVGFTKAFEVRADIYKWVGKIHFKGNRFTLFAGDADVLTLLNLQGPARNTGYNTGIVSEMPSSIIMDRTNEIRVTGTRSDGSLSNPRLQVLLMFNDWDAAQSQNLIVGGRIDLAPRIVFDNPDPLPGRTVPSDPNDEDSDPVTVGAGAAKCKIRYVNFRRMIGGTYEMAVDGLPDLHVEVLAGGGGPKSEGRVDLTVRNVQGQRLISTTPGGCRVAEVETRNAAPVVFEIPPYARDYARIGDERWITFDPTQASDAVITPVTGSTATVPSGATRVIVRGGAPHFRLVLPALSSDGRLRLEIEEGTLQTRTTVQCIPPDGDTITDGFLTASPVPLTVQFDGSTALVRTGTTWTIGDASSPVPSLKTDFVNGAYRYGYLVPPTTRTLTQLLAFTNGGTGSTYIGADGVCRDASANTLRETYDPATKAYLGPLWEAFEGRNYVANASSSAGPAYSTNAVGSPALQGNAGALGLYRVYPGAAIHRITPDSGNQNCGALSVDVPANSIVCVSLYLWIPPDCSGTLTNIFDLRNVTSGLTNAVIRSAVFDRRSCWQRVWTVIRNDGNATVTSQVRLQASGIRSPGDEQYPNRDMYVTCPQVERDTDYPSSFIPVPSATVPVIRAADTVAFAANTPLDVLSGFTIMAEMVWPALPQTGMSGGVGIGNDAAGSTSSARLYAAGDPDQPYLVANVTGRSAASATRLMGSSVTPGRASRLALGFSENDQALEDGLGGRVTQSLGMLPDNVGRTAILDARTPVILRTMEVYRG